MGIKSGVAIIVLAVCLMLAGCPGKPAAPSVSAPRASGGQLNSIKDVSKILDTYKKTKTLTDNQRSQLESASLSPRFDVSAMAFLVLMICNEDGMFPSGRLQELFATKATAVDPKHMHLHVQTYRNWVKTPVLGGKLLFDASESGNWSSFSSEAETICTQTLQDAAPNVRAQAGAVLAAYQGLPTVDLRRVLALVELGARKAGNANEQRYWAFIKKTVESRSP